jgi:hypothetical protein
MVPPSNESKSTVLTCASRPRTDHQMSARHDAPGGSEPVTTTVSSASSAPWNRVRVRVPPATALAPDPLGKIAVAVSPAAVTAGPGNEAHQRASRGGGATIRPEAAAMASMGGS